MPEPLSRELVASVLADMAIVHPRSVPAETAALDRMVDLYRNAMVGLSGDAVRAAAKRWTQDSKYFPKPSELREYAFNWERYQSSTVRIPTGPTSDLWCPSCRSVAAWQERWRPVVTGAGGDSPTAPLASADGVYLLLESYERLMCECAPKAIYLPLDGVSPAAMLLRDAPSHIAKRIALSTTRVMERAA